LNATRSGQATDADEVIKTVIEGLFQLLSPAHDVLL